MYLCDPISIKSLDVAIRNYGTFSEIQTEISKPGALRVIRELHINLHWEEHYQLVESAT